MKGFDPEEKSRALARMETAWTEVLKTENGRLVVMDIVVDVCGHLVPAFDSEKRVRQQVALEILHRSGLYDVRSGSFPYDYISMLTSAKLHDDSPGRTPTTVTPARKTLLGRLLGRNKN